MLNQNNTIPCPVCAEQGKDTKIMIDTMLLIAGTQFTCPVCLAKVGIETNSKSQLDQTTQKFENLKS